MEAILFSTVFTAALGYPYWRFTHRKTEHEFVDDHEPTNHEIRQSPEYREWRISVLKRDGFQCLWCKRTDSLEAHHIYSFASFPELRFDIKNGISLCSECHKLTPNYGSKQKKFDQRIKEI